MKFEFPLPPFHHKEYNNATPFYFVKDVPKLFVDVKKPEALETIQQLTNICPLYLLT